MKLIQYISGHGLCVSLCLVLASCGSTQKSAPSATEYSNTPSKTQNLLSSTPSQLRSAPNEKEILFLMKDPQGISEEQLFTYDLDSKKISRRTFLFGKIFQAEYKTNQQIILLSNTDLLKERPVYLYPNLDQLSSGDIYLLSQENQLRVTRLTKTGSEKTLGKNFSNLKYSTEIFLASGKTYAILKNLEKSCYITAQKIPNSSSDKSVAAVYLVNSKKIVLSDGLNFQIQDIRSENEASGLELSLKACDS